MKKKGIVIFIAIFSFLLVLGACGKKEKVEDTTPNTPVETPVTPETPETPAETNNNNNNEATGENVPNNGEEAVYGFTSFDLEIDLVDLNDAIEADYEVEPNETDAKYENKIENFNLHGDEAMDKLDAIFKELALTYEMADEEVIKKVAEAFGVTDYQKFDLEIKFENNNEKEYKVTK